MSAHRILLPAGWPRPRGYANGILARGTLIFTGGVIGWDASERIVGGGLAAQFRQALENTVAILAEAGARPEHVVRMTWFLTDLDAYRRELAGIGSAYRAVFGRTYPAMAVIGVSALVEPAALVEIETTAVIPDAEARS